MSKEIIEDLPNHTSFVFEDICRRTILALSGMKIGGIKFPLINKVGAWWDRKGNEINIVGVKGKKAMIVGEVKWRRKKVSSNEVQLFLERIRRLKVRDTMTIYVSWSGFTRGAQEIIEESNIIPITEKELCGIWNLLESISSKQLK